MLLALISIYTISKYNFAFFSFFVWTPWLNLFNDYFIVQLSFLIVLYYMFFFSNVYNILFFLTLQLFICGIFLSIYQLELFTAFLWVVELTVVLVSLLLLFYLNISGTTNYYHSNINYLLISLFFIFFIFLNFFIPCELNLESYNNLLYYYYYYFNDYYEALNFIASNDVNSLTISYYTFNSLELIIIGLLLLIGSVICVNINLMQRNNKNVKIDSSMSISNIYNFLLNNIFIRKQNMTTQNISRISLNIFKKMRKKKNVKIMKD